MTDLTSLSLSELSKLLQLRAVSPVEVVEAHLRRISEINPGLNAVVTLAEDSIEHAKWAEDVITRGESKGPLQGLPLTVKDTIETAGLRTTSGSLMRANFVPQADAPAVARLKEAGAIIIGKTNAAEMAMDYTAYNPVFGRTNHPQDSSRTPGGSSGGEAAAIAAHMSPGGIGSDLAGSVRIPAHFCGIAALKPTAGRVPGGGQMPPANGPYSLGSVVGPMARNVADLSLLYSSLSGTPLPFISEHQVGLRGARIAWYADDDVSPVTTETRAAVQTAARILEDAGLRVEERRPPGIERGHELWLKMFSRASVLFLRSIYTGNEEKGGDFVSWRLAHADDEPVQTIDEYINSWMERDFLRGELVRWMEDVPIILAPVGATAAFEHGAHKVEVNGQNTSIFRAFSYCQTYNVFDLPVVVVPVGKTAEGLPIGVQVIGRPFEEEAVLAAASLIEGGLG